MVTRADIEAKAKQIEDALQETKQAAKTSAVWLAVGVVAIVAFAFIFGRRKGKEGKAVVEVYRV
ncbi:MAG TPA: hypothetical protein VLT15_04225 [Acidimicrobiia bacterium]|nr:hypothetical protein [Acidimicrobiia bacterium]